MISDKEKEFMNRTPEQGALLPADQDPHYVRSVTEVGERNEVVAQEDIYAANGMKLLAKGAKIDRSKWEHLAGHKLKTPLDMLLSAADSVDGTSLARDIDNLVSHDTLLSTIVSRSGDPQGYKSVLGAISIPKPISFRLTVMRDDRKDLYDHCLKTAVIAHCIGARMKLPSEQLKLLMLVSLCHDLGEMHTDPAILVSGRKIKHEERKFIYVHPVTGFVVLKEMKDVPAEVMKAVLQHHERLDGSGYPYADTDKAICLPARIMAIAETLEAVVRQFGANRLSIVFRLNQHALDPMGVKAVGELLPSYVQLPGEGSFEPTSDERLNRLSKVLQVWPDIRKRLEKNTQNDALQFMHGRMVGLQSLAFQAGLAPELFGFFDSGNDDAKIIHELNVALDEMNRLLDNVALEIDRRISHNHPCRQTADSVLQLLQPGAC